MRLKRYLLAGLCLAVGCADLLLLSAWLTGHPDWFFAQRPARDVESVGIQPGQQMAAMPVTTLTGEDVGLESAWAQRPALIMTASVTCPLARRNAAALERIRVRFGDRIDVVVVYLVEAHPDDVASPYSDDVWVTDLNVDAGILYPQPTTLHDRLKLAAEFAAVTQCTASIYVDRMDNRFWAFIGRASNVGLLVDTNGQVLARSGWFDEEKMTTAIAALESGPR